jgi:PAS domain S-box-containing protein
MWEKVILNLLSNALKFTFEGGIRVSVAADGQHAVVEVRDTGIGVSPEEMPRLFERFHRIPTTRSRSNEGSGIGLALVQELVLLHGGTIDARSTVDAGTTFTIRLPVGSGHLPADQLAPTTGSDTATQTAQPFVQEALRWLPEPADQLGGSASTVVAAPVRPHASRARVLVADDNADMREYLRRLRSGQYEVTAVDDGLTALAAVRADSPDLVIADVMMPGLDGLELVGALRSDSRTAEVSIILLSARAGQEAAVEGLSAGADDYLVKPFAAQELLARVRANVDLARLRNHHAQWRAALINSLQEGFFVADADGAIVEINAAFTEILGYPAEELPYPAPAPWWPNRDGDPAAYQQVMGAFERVMANQQGNGVIPLRHRDGHQLWAAVAINPAQDDQGVRKLVGTIRDVTAERYAAQRDTALNAMNESLSAARTVPEVLRAAVGQLREQWQAVAAFARAGTVSAVDTAPDSEGAAEPSAAMAALDDVRSSRILMEPGDSGRPVGVGASVESALGPVAVWLNLDPARRFEAEDQTLLSLLCGSMAQALHRAYAFDQQREVAVTLQRSILGPVVLPSGFAARYQPASRPLEVGGDWYDAVELPDGRIGIMVGDCVGRGLPAATIMGQLRSAGRALLLRATGPAEVLTALDQFTALLPDATCTTALCAILDPRDGTLIYSSAGHPPAVLALPGGHTELLTEGRGASLGVRLPAPRTQATAVVPPRGVLLLYTDGLIERRRHPLDEGIRRAAAIVQDGYELPVDQLADRIMHEMTDRGGATDDVALLLYRHPAPLDMSFAAEPGELAPARAALRAWLERTGGDARMVHSVLVAAGEACANAIEHGYREAHGRVRLAAQVVGGRVDITVTDAGAWRPETHTQPDG